MHGRLIGGAVAALFAAFLVTEPTGVAWAQSSDAPVAADGSTPLSTPDVRWPDAGERATMDELAATLADALNEGRLDAAQRAADDLQSLEIATFGPDHPIAAIRLRSMGQIAEERGDLAGAIDLYRRALAMSRARLGADHAIVNGLSASVAYAAFGLAMPAVQAEDWMRAEPFLREAASLADGDAEFALYANDALGMVLEEQRQFAEALLHRRTAFDIAVAIAGADHPMTLDVGEALARAQVGTGQIEEAVETYRNVADRRGNMLGAEHPDTLRAFNNLAVELNRLQRHEEALVIDEDVTEIRLRTLGPDHPDTLRSRENLGSTLDDLGRVAEALAILEDVEARRLAVQGPDHPDTLGTQEQLARTLMTVGRPDEALALLRTAASARASIQGADHPETLIAESLIAAALTDTGQFNAAADRNAALIPRIAAVFGADALDTLTVMNNRAVALGEAGRLEESASAHRDMVDRRRAVLGPEHPATLSSLNSLSTILGRMGRLEEAQALMEQVVDGRQRVLGPDHPDTLVSMGNLARSLADLGRVEEGEALARRALAAYERSGGLDDRDAIATLGNLASILATLDRTDEAIAINREVHRIYAATLGPDHPDTLTRLSNLAGLLPLDEAEPLAREAHEGMAARLGAGHPESIALASRLADILDRQGKSAEAETLRRETLVVAQEALGADHPRVGPLLTGLAWSALGRADGDEAVRLFERVADIYAASYGRSHFLTLNTLSYLGRARLSVGDAEGALADGRAALAGWRERMVGGSSTHDATRAAQNTALRRSSRLVVEATSQLAQTASDDALTDLMAEGFEAIQAQSMDGAAAAMARAAARGAADQTGVGAVVRELEAARARRDALDATLASMVSDSATAEIDPRRAETVEARIAAQSAVEDAEATLQASFPDFFDLVMPAPLTFAELVGLGGYTPLLRDSEALIVLAPGDADTEGFIFALTRDDVVWAGMPMDAGEIGAAIAILHTQLDGGSGTRAARAMRRRETPAFDRALAYDLYTGLFGNSAVTDVIGDKPDWIIAPQGVLLSLPFNALVTRAPVGEDTDPVALRQTGWLGIERAISVLPTLSAMRSQRGQATAAAPRTGERLFAIGDPDFAGQGEVLVADASLTLRDAGARAAGVRDLAPLPATRREVLAIAELHEASESVVLLGSEATESALMAANANGTLREASTILLATHGLLAGTLDSLAEPALAMTPPRDPMFASSGDGWVDDGLLTASEAALLDLNADWVILSACDTAAGAGPDAGGLTGLARAFFHAGARSLLVSHWKVLDDVTARLTTSTLDRLIDDPSTGRARAFQQAMAEIIADDSLDGTSLALSHPSVWAPFQIIGVE